MNIFADFHHSGLAYSLHLLFEKRLNFKLYFPIGLDWFEKGYWNIARPYNDSPETVKQYLCLDERYEPKDNTPSLNVITNALPTHYEIADISHTYIRRSITFEQFLSMDIDLIIASIPDHYVAYSQLRDIYKPKARVICQMGNMFDNIDDLCREGYVKNLMASTIRFDLPSFVNSVFYHQEINTSVFNYEEPIVNATPQITSFVNVLPKPELFTQYKNALPSARFLAYGASCPDGCIETIQDISRIMGQSTLAYHVKPGGDGFGHIMYDWAFKGRPIITDFNDYQDKLASELLEANVTAINITGNNFEKNVSKIRELLLDHERVLRMGRALHERVTSIVDYQQEAHFIQKFIERLN